MAAVMDRLRSNGSRDTDAKLARLIRDRYDEANTAQRWEQLQYGVVRSYMGGDQHVYIHRNRNSIENLPRDPSRVRITDNRIASNTRTIYAKLLKRPLVFEVVPTASDDATLRGARLAEAVATDLANRQRWEQALRRPALVALWEGGTSILSLDWNPAAGTALGVREDGKSFGTGDISTAVSSVTEAFCEPGTQDIETAWWWVRAQALPPAVVQRHYRLEDQPAADVNAALGPSARSFVQGSRRDNPIHLTLVLTYYERPNPERTEGLVATIVGDKVVAKAPWPFPFKDRLNCVAMRESFVSHRWTGESITYQAVSLQNAINAHVSSLVEHMKLAGNARLMVPDTSLDLIDELTDTPGEVVPFNAAAGAPQYLSPPQLAAWLVQLGDRLAARIDDIMGVHDISRGAAPANIESGVGLSILAENDDTPVGFLAREMAEGFSRFMSLCLQTYAAKASERRTARVVMPGGVTEQVRWTGGDLQGQTEATVPLDAVMPRSRAAARAQALEMVKLGLIESVEEYELVAEVSPRDRLSSTVKPAADKARREIHQLVQGIAVVPRDFDDHRTIITEVNRYRMSGHYDLLPEDRQLLIDEYAQAHENLAAEDQAKKLAQTAVSPALAAAPEANEGEPLPNELPPAEQGQAVPTGGGMEVR